MSSSEIEKLVFLLNDLIEDDGLIDTPIDGLKLFKASEPTVEETVVYDPCLCVVARGGKEIVVGDTVYTYNPAQSLIVSVDMPAYTRVSEASSEEPCIALVLEIHGGTIAELLSEGTSVGAPRRAERAVGVTPINSPLLQALTRLVALLTTPDDIRALSPLILREVHYRLLTGVQGEQLRQVAVPGAPAQRIADAISWIKEHYSERMRVENLAGKVGLSSSAFYQHFKAVTSLSPVQYQKRFRLQEARRLMMSDGLGAAEAAFAVGYESPSQFGREYRRLFGASPTKSVTIVAATP